MTTRATMTTRMMICCRGFLIAGLVLSAACAVALGAPRKRDVWYACIADGRRYGYQHTTVTALPDGNFQYTLESRVLYDLLGMKQEQKHRIEYVVTAAYEPVSLRGEGNQASGSSLIVGRVEASRMMLRIERAGFKRRRTIDLSGKPIFDECLDDWLNDQPADLKDTTVDIIDPEFGDVLTATLKRRTSDRSESRWHLDVGNLQQGVISYDADGIRREAEFTVPRMHTTRVAAAEARQIEYRKWGGRDLLMFPLGEKITVPERLTSLTVKLTWTNIPFDRFKLEDDRQRITQRSQKDGRFGVVLQIEPAQPLPVDTRYPIEGPEFEPYLAETRFIKPHDAEIAAKARQWTRGKETVLEAVRALSTAVYNHLEGGSMIAETLSGPEVLQSKQGKCSEYTTLFASLARSLGIPTRVVFGERMLGGNWGGHAWCEVYAGRWITVDPNANEVGSSMALLKFSHSDTLLGDSSLRWALTESLDISIDGFKMRPNALAGRFKTGLSGRIYTNVDAACRFTVPSDNWSIRDQSPAGGIMIRFDVPKRKDVKIHLVAYGLPAGISLKTISAAQRRVFKQMYNDFKILEDDPYTVNGIGGYRLVYQHSSKEGKEEEKLKTTQVVWTRGAFGYLLNMAAEESAHDKCAGDFYKLLASFEDLNEIPAP